jgi:DNA polymerase III subunit epsilon
VTREIVLDTETTGLDPAKGDRIIEIGAVELINHMPSGKHLHLYINPERDISPDAVAVHGITAKMLEGKPVFADIAATFLEFIADSVLVIHNADFDMAFLNAELAYVSLPLLANSRVVDTLKLARQKFPMAPNSLDALCKRFSIDNSKRTKHGALLDSELLASVYLELIGGQQTAFSLADAKAKSQLSVSMDFPAARQRPEALPPRFTDEERLAHAAHVAKLGQDALWAQMTE